MYNLGIYCENGEGGLVVDKEAACQLYLRAAEAGSAQAQYLMGKRTNNKEWHLKAGP